MNSSSSSYVPAHRVLRREHYFSGFELQQHHIVLFDPTGYFLNANLHFMHNSPIQAQHYTYVEEHNEIFEWIREDEGAMIVDAVERNPISTNTHNIRRGQRYNVREDFQGSNWIQEDEVERNPMSTIRRGPRNRRYNVGENNQTYNIRRGPRNRRYNVREDFQGSNWIQQDEEAMIVDALPQHIPVTVGGLSENAISKCLKTRKCNEDEDGSDEICTICQDALLSCDEEDDDIHIIGVLNCGHQYHVKCIKKWLQVKNLCPLCKTTGLDCP